MKDSTREALLHGLAHQGEDHPVLWYPLLFLAIFVFFHLFGAVAAFVAPVGEAIPVWTILAAGLAAMVWWLWRSHPRLGRRIRSAGDLENRDHD